MSLADAKPNAVAAWSLDEASGTRNDQVGASHLTDNNFVASAAGQFGNAADFEAANSDSLSVADNASLSGGDVKMCWRAWVQLESKGATRFILTKNNASDGEYLLEYVTASDRFQLRVYGAAGFGSSGVVTATNAGSPSVGTWYLIHAWHDSVANEIGIAVNAGTANTASHTAGIYDSAAAFYIGSASAFPSLWDGLIDDVVVLKNYILDATERTEDYNSGTGVAFADWDAGGGGGLSIPIAMYHYKRMMA